MKNRIKFFGLIALFNLAANYAHPVTPTYFKQLHLDNSMFGLAFSVMSLGIFLASPFWGKVTGYINSKTAMAIGSIGYAFAQFLFAIGHVPSVILIGRLIAGLACGAFFVGALNYIVNLSEDGERGSNLTFNATVQTVASAIGYFIGGTIGDKNVYVALTVQVIQLTLVGLAYYFFLDEDANHKQQASFKQILAQSNPFERFLDGKLFMTKQFALLFATSTLLYLGYTAFDQTFNYYLKDVFNLRSSFNGIFKGAIGLISLTVNTTIGIYAMKHTKVKRTFIVVLLGLTTMMTCMLFSGSLAMYIGFSVVFYGFYSLSSPILQNLVTNEAKDETRNIVLGFYQSTQSLGQIFGAYVAGVIYNFSVQAPFYLAAGSFLLAVISCILYSQKTVRN